MRIYYTSTINSFRAYKLHWLAWKGVFSTCHIDTCKNEIKVMSSAGITKSLCSCFSNRCFTLRNRNDDIYFTFISLESILTNTLHITGEGLLSRTEWIQDVRDVINDPPIFFGHFFFGWLLQNFQQTTNKVIFQFNLKVPTSLVVFPLANITIINIKISDCDYKYNSYLWLVNASYEHFFSHPTVQNRELFCDVKWRHFCSHDGLRLYIREFWQARLLATW